MRNRTGVVCVFNAALAVVTGLLAVTTATALPNPTFGSVTLSTAGNPAAAKIGDLDGDGRNDIAVVTQQGNLQLFFNNGAGSFQAVSFNGLWAPSSQILDLDIGDLNGDGRNDIVVANGTVSVILNLGNRTFSSPVNYNVCSASNAVAIGDLDGDGDRDLAVTGGCAQASILLNNGHGVFTAGGTYGNGAASRSLILVDINCDDVLDIAYLNVTAGGFVTGLINNGNATFGLPSHLYAGDLPSDLATGDFDRDGTPDLVIANAYFSQVILLLNDSNGTFTTGYSELNADDTPTSIVVGDFNLDSYLDFAVASWGNNKVRIILNQGFGNFGNAIEFPVGQNPVKLIAGRLDSDPFPDLITVNQTGGTLTLLLSTVGAPPPPMVTLSTPANGASGVSTAPALIWNASTGANSYDVYLSSSFPPTAVTVSVGITGYNASGLTPNTTYYWKVVAKNASGSSPASAVWSFTTGQPPTAVMLLAPANGASGVSTSPTLSWTASAGATFYDVYLSTSNPPPTVTAGAVGASYNQSGLTPNTRYYWKVVAKNAAGSSPGSAVWSFTTAQPPPPPSQGPVTLTVSSRISGLFRLVDLHWSGATTANVEIYRNGSRITTTSNNGSYSDRFGFRSHGSYTYRVCAPGTGVCSSDVPITF